MIVATEASSVEVEREGFVLAASSTSPELVIEREYLGTADAEREVVRELKIGSTAAVAAVAAAAAQGVRAWLHVQWFLWSAPAAS